MGRDIVLSWRTANAREKFLLLHGVFKYISRNQLSKSEVKQKFRLNEVERISIHYQSQCDSLLSDSKHNERCNFKGLIKLNFGDQDQIVAGSMNGNYSLNNQSERSLDVASLTLRPIM